MDNKWKVLEGVFVAANSLDVSFSEFISSTFWTIIISERPSPVLFKGQENKRGYKKMFMLLVAEIGASLSLLNYYYYYFCMFIIKGT